MSHPRPLSGLQHRARTRRSALAGELIGALAAVDSPAAGVAPEAPGDATEYQLKAAFLLNLARFVDWPAEAIGPPDAPLQLCLFGRDQLADSLHALEQQPVHGRTLQLRRIRDTAEFAGCHILFVARSEATRLRALLPALATRPLLTVSDIRGFAAAGGDVELLSSDHRLQFDVNWATLRRAGLRIGSAALRLARNVIGLNRSPQE